VLLAIHDPKSESYERYRSPLSDLAYRSISQVDGTLLDKLIEKHKPYATPGPAAVGVMLKVLEELVERMGKAKRDIGPLVSRFYHEAYDLADTDPTRGVLIEFLTPKLTFGDMQGYAVVLLEYSCGSSNILAFLAHVVDTWGPEVLHREDQSRLHSYLLYMLARFEDPTRVHSLLSALAPNVDSITEQQAQHVIEQSVYPKGATSEGLDAMYQELIRLGVDNVAAKFTLEVCGCLSEVQVCELPYRLELLDKYIPSDIKTSLVEFLQKQKELHEKLKYYTGDKK